MTAPKMYLSQLRAWGVWGWRIVVARPLLGLILFVLPLSSLCLAGSSFSAIIRQGESDQIEAVVPLKQTRWHAFDFPLVAPQGPDLDYSKFLHSSQRHSSLACTACHE